MVITTTASGPATPGPASRRVASMPSIPGIRMSKRHTSGRSRRASSTACRPSGARLYESLGFVTLGVAPGAFHHPTLGFVGLRVMWLDLA